MVADVGRLGPLNRVVGSALGTMDGLGRLIYKDGKNFTESGWGDLPTVVRLTSDLLTPPDAETCISELTSFDALDGVESSTGWEMVEGVEMKTLTFPSPAYSDELENVCPMVKDGGEMARVRIIKPPDSDLAHLPLFISSPPAGFEGFSKIQRLTGLPLAKHHGIGSLLLEPPMYGSRRAGHRKEGNASRFEAASDMMVQAAVVAAELRALTGWAYSRLGAKDVVLGGMSFGGLMAGVVASSFPSQLGIPGCVIAFAPASPERVFGCPSTVMGSMTDYHALAISPNAPENVTCPDSARDVLQQELRKHASLLSRPIPPAFDLSRSERGRGQLIAATHDKFVHRDMFLPLADYYGVPVDDVVWVLGGHFSSFLLHSPVFCQAVSNASNARVL